MFYIVELSKVYLWLFLNKSEKSLEVTSVLFKIRKSIHVFRHKSIPLEYAISLHITHPYKDLENLSNYNKLPHLAEMQQDATQLQDL